MVANNFTIGDVVNLKSGDPQMAVKVIDASGVLCTWFNNGELKEQHFEPATLEEYEPYIGGVA